MSKLNLVDEIFAIRKCELCSKVILQAEYTNNKGICLECRIELEREPIPLDDDDNELELHCDCGNVIGSQDEIEQELCIECIQKKDQEELEERKHPDQK